MTIRESSQNIDEAAADWVARRDRAELKPEDEAAFKLWLQGDSRRPGALLRAQAVYQRTAAAVALGEAYDPADFREAERPASPPAMTRRKALMWGGGLAATLLVGGIGLGLNSTTAYATSRGEIRLVRLDDGSTIFLNTDTKVEVAYKSDERTVDLVRGEAFFTAKKSATQPFLVNAGDKVIRTDGGAFRVRMLENAGTDILVREGAVRASQRETGLTDAVLRPGMRLALPADAGLAAQPVTVSSEEILRDLAWREGNIAFQGESLRRAADTFARYGDPRIEVTDDGLARETVTGLFAANDPVGFSRAVARIFGATVSVQGNRILIGRTAV